MLGGNSAFLMMVFFLLFAMIIPFGGSTGEASSIYPPWKGERR